MKNTIIISCLFTLATFHLHAATCSNGSLANLAALGSAGCTITNGSNTWTLTDFALSATPTGNFAGLSADSINISFSLFGLGFSVTTSTAGGFRVLPGQTGFVETSYQISGNVGGALLTSFGASVNPGSYSEGIDCPQCSGPPEVELVKYVQSLNSLSLPPEDLVQLQLTATYANLAVGSNSAFSSPQTLNPGLLAANVGSLVIIDQLSMIAGDRNGASANVASYTNYFTFSRADQPQIPEPMTCALMGAGLAGLAMMRQRRS